MTRPLPTLAAICLLLLSATASGAASERHGEWLRYIVPPQDGAPVIHVVETATPIRGITVIYSCTPAEAGPSESLLLLNPGFRELPEGLEDIEALFTFGGEGQRGYADAGLKPDRTHGTLDVTRGLQRVLQQMRQYRTFIVTQADAPITEVAIPLDGFATAYDRARAACAS